MPFIILKSLRESGKQKLFLIPYFFTFANALFGFLSIIKTLDEDFIAAAFCIVFAACMDFFDGKLARKFNSTSSVGMELDSLCDAISFCLAPTVLLYSRYLCDEGIIGIVVVTLYLCSGLFRLAKFNATYTPEKTFFLGLPTTVAAFFLMSLVIHHSSIATSSFAFLIAPRSIIFLIASVALLMISLLRFPSSNCLKSYPMFSYCIAVLSMSLLSSFLCGYPFFLIISSSYIISALLYNFYYCLLR